MGRRKEFIAIQDAMDVGENRWWYYIPGFNGYELSHDGYIRSMKHYRKYPFGILIKPKQDGQDPSFELTGNDGERYNIHLSQIAHLVKTSTYDVAGYPRQTCITNYGGRIDNRLTIKNLDRVNKNKTKLDTLHYHKFRVVENGDEAYGMTKSVPDVRTPIKSTKGDMCYGRTDCRSLSDFNV